MASHTVLKADLNFIKWVTAPVELTNIYVDSMAFNFLDVLMFLGLSQGVFLIFAIIRLKDRNQIANRILALILLLCSLILASRFVYTQHFSPWMLRWIALPDTIILAIGPLTYGYVHTLLLKKKLKTSFLRHLAPFSIYLFLALFLAFSPLNVLLDWGVKSWLPIVYLLVEGFAIGFNFFMVAKGQVVIYRFKSLEAAHLSYKQQPLTYLNIFLLTLFVVLLLWSLVFVAKLFGISLGALTYDTVWIIIPIQFYIISYFMLGESKPLRFAAEKKATNSSRLRPDRIASLRESLDKLMSEEKVYLNNELTLKNLADQVDSSSNDISWLLNEVYKKSFYDYINSFRIRAFIKQLEARKYANKTLLSLAMDVGFNSKSTFNNTFKKEVGMTPREYLKNMSD